MSLKACDFKWYVVPFHKDHLKGKAKTAKLAKCELEDGHDGAHENKKYGKPEV